MPGGLVQQLALCNGSSSLSGPASKGTSITATAKSYTGSFTTLVASTPVDTCWMEVTIWPTGNTSNRCFTQIAVGAALSEQIVINDLMATSSTAGSSATTYSFPINIPAGSRISARCNNTIADQNNIQIRLYDGSFVAEGYSGIDSLGFISANPSGVDIDPGATVNTKGAYSQIVASTPRDYGGIMIAVGQNSTDNAAFTAPVQFDIAIGPGGSEVVIVPDFVSGMNATNLTQAWISVIPIQIPAGTRMAVRAASGNNTAGTRVIGCTLFGVYY